MQGLLLKSFLAANLYTFMVKTIILATATVVTNIPQVDGSGCGDLENGKTAKERQSHTCFMCVYVLLEIAAAEIHTV